MDFNRLEDRAGSKNLSLRGQGMKKNRFEAKFFPQEGSIRTSLGRQGTCKFLYIYSPFIPMSDTYWQKLTYVDRLTFSFYNYQQFFLWPKNNLCKTLRTSVGCKLLVLFKRISGIGQYQEFIGRGYFRSWRGGGTKQTYKTQQKYVYMYFCSI